MVSNVLAVLSLVCLGLSSAAPNRPDDVECKPVTYWDCQPRSQTSGLPSCDHEEVCSNVNGKTQCRHLPRADKCVDDSGKVCTKKTGETCMVIKTPTDPLSVEKVSAIQFTLQPVNSSNLRSLWGKENTWGMVGVNTPARRLGGAALSLWWIGPMSLKIGNETEIAIDTQLICFRTANTLSECASSLNNGICRERVTGCEDCNKVV